MIKVYIWSENLIHAWTLLTKKLQNLIKFSADFLLVVKIKVPRRNHQGVIRKLLKTTLNMIENLSRYHHDLNL